MGNGRKPIKSKKILNTIQSSKRKPIQKQPSTKKVNARIQNSDGEVIFAMANVSAPASWSQTAIDIAASKYFRRSVKKENSVFKLVDRVLSGLETALKKSGYLTSSQQKKLLARLREHLLSQRAAFNSPVWFNCGLYESYGIKSYKAPQCSACFILSIEDSLDSIFDLVKTEARLFKHGSGSGTNFSPLRSYQENLDSGGTSSGLLSFLEILDKSAGAIKSGGTTRRAAKMVCVDVDHPEIMEFIQWKTQEEKKAKALIQAGYSAALDGEAYKTISGQNANNSVRITDQFMHAVVENKNWSLKARTTKKTMRTLPAQKIWQAICQSAWECADPGLQFHDTINKFHTCPQAGPIQASNPCSEYMFLNDSACNLASLNLAQFFDGEQFDLENYLEVIGDFIIAQEALVDYAGYPTKKIKENSEKFRTLGLGFANLGSLLMRMGLAYDSEEARSWAAALAALLSGKAYLQSAQVAAKKGAFVGFKKNKQAMLEVISRHEKALKKINWSFLPAEFKTHALAIWKEASHLGKKYGFRNAQVTAIAPTGTIGLVMDCDTTGIEPEYALIKFKKLVGGGSLQIINQSVEKSLKKLGYAEQEQKKISEFILQNNSVIQCAELKPEHRAVFATATGDNVISAAAHLYMMSAVQPFISGAISKTVNLPQSATVEDISEVYRTAWMLGLKSIALYRDGSKFVQPLATSQTTAISLISSQNPTCTICGSPTQLESGCYRCLNCGTTTSCAS